MHGGKKQKPSPGVFKSQESLLIEGILFGIIIDRTHHWGNQTQMLFQEKELFEVKTFVPSSQVLEAQKMSNHFGFSFPTKVYSNLSFSPPSPLHSLLGVIRNFISR